MRSLTLSESTMISAGVGYRSSEEWLVTGTLTGLLGGIMGGFYYGIEYGLPGAICGGVGGTIAGALVIPAMTVCVTVTAISVGVMYQYMGLIDINEL